MPFRFLVGIILCSGFIIAGTTPSKSTDKRRHKLITYSMPFDSEDTFFERDKILNRRLKILASTRSEKKQSEDIAEMYLENVHLFETPDDFITLLKPPRNSDEKSLEIIQKANDIFLDSQLQKFFDKKPELLDITVLADYICFSVSSAIAIKKMGLRVITEPSHYVTLFKYRGSKAYDSAQRDIMLDNLLQFKSSNPTIKNIIDFYNIIMRRNFFNPKILALTLNKLFQVFAEPKNSLIAQALVARTQDAILAADKSKHEKEAALLRLYESAAKQFVSARDYCSVLIPAKKFVKYKVILQNAAENFLTLHIDEFFSKKPTITEIKNIADYATHTIDMAIEIKTKGLEFVRSAKDYLNLVIHNLYEIYPGGNFEEYDDATTNFIRYSLNIFKKTNPTIDNIITLHKYLLEIQRTDEATTVATLIKLKELFIKNFTGSDLIRFLDPISYCPGEIYIRQKSL